MTWGDDRWCFAIAVVLFLAALYPLTAAYYRYKLEKSFGAPILGRVVPLSVSVRRGIRDSLWVLGGVCVVAALAEPRLHEQILNVEQKGVDLVLVIDLSRSMDAQDVDPSRLERARREIGDLLELSQGDRIGVVIYAGAAFPRLPLTEDERIVDLVVQELDTSAFEAQGSELGEAIREAMKLLGEPKQAGQGIVVFSDGEVHRPEDALAAAESAKERKIRIYTVGIGEKLAPIPLPDGSYMTDGGSVAKTQPSLEILTDLAKITGGAVVKSVAAADDMASLYDEIRAGMTSGARGSMQKKISESAFQWPLGFGLLAWLTAAWLGEGRGVARGAQLTAVLFAFTFANTATAATLEQADGLFRSGRFAEAVDAFQEIAAENPDDPDVWSRLAAARYRAGDAEGAARAWEEQDRLAGGDADALYNAGNAHYKAHRLDRALEMYQRALELEPSHPGAAKNEGLVRKELEARRQKPPPKQAPKEGQPKDGGSSGEPQGEPQEPGSEGGKPKEGEPDPKPAENGDPTGPGEKGKPSPGPEPGSKDGMSGQDGGEPDPKGEPGTDPSDLKGNPGEGSSQPGDGEPTDGKMSATQAGKLVDGVEEGRPRVFVPGQSTGKPW